MQLATLETAVFRQKCGQALFVVDAEDDDAGSNLARRFDDYLTRLASQYFSDHPQTFGLQESDLPGEIIRGIRMSELEEFRGGGRQQQT